MSKKRMFILLLNALDLLTEGIWEEEVSKKLLIEEIGLTEAEYQIYILNK